MKRTISAGLAVCVLLCSLLFSACASYRQGRSAFLYIDPISGAQFMVPAGWEQISSEEQVARGTVVFYAPQAKERVNIVFSCHDFWDDMTDEEQKLFSRNKMDNSLYTIADIAEMANCTLQDVSMVTYNGREYFCAKVVDDMGPMVRLFRVEYGYLYQFAFAGYQRSKMFADFKKLVSSAVYPQPVQPTTGFSFTDPMGGTTFAVPAGWKEDSVSEYKGCLIATFVSTKKESVQIRFQNMDMYGEYAQKRVLPIPRSEVNNDRYTKAKIATIHSCNEEDVSMASYGGQEYFFINTVVEGKPELTLTRYENGYWYSFIFTADIDDVQFSDFEALVSSVVYPQPSQD